MKLYNLFEEVILEEIERNRTLLTEGVSFDDVKAAIDGKYNVNILYRDYEDQPPSKRYIQVYNLAKTKSGNDAIRAYQIFGASKKGNKNGFWKIFRLDRIEGWFPTKVRWAKPVSDIEPNVPKYNANGDRSMSSVMYKVNVNQPTKTTNI
jgi:predicted DNA-binding transcriptional regulator YafY